MQILALWILSVSDILSAEVILMDTVCTTVGGSSSPQQCAEDHSWYNSISLTSLTRIGKIGTVRGGLVPVLPDVGNHVSAAAVCPTECPPHPTTTCPPG